MSDVPGLLAGIFVVTTVMAATAFIGRRFLATMSDFRRMYQDDRAPLFIRYVPAHMHLWAAALVGFVVLALLPKELARPLSVLPIAVAVATFALAYIRPTAQLPVWLQAELDDGRVALARPEFLDWLLFWIVIPVAVIGLIGVIFLSLWGTNLPR
jgi:hypothetical protein